jgi:cytoskeleton protein RodZ
VADEEIGAGSPVGEYLKSVRQSRGVDLDEASKVTKISKNNLIAMEEGAFDRLPSPAYIKGFLKLYATYLSLPPDEIVQMYERAQPQPEARPEPEAKVERPKVPLMNRSRMGGPGRWMIPALLLALVIVAAIFFSDGEEKRAPQAPPQQPAQPVPAAAPAAAPAAVMPPRSSAATAAAPQGQAHTPAQPQASPPAQAPKQAGLVLKLRFTRDSWLSITIDDSISQRYDLKAGDVIEWKASKGFILDVGDGGAVEAEFNGKPLKALGEPGKPAHVELKD